MNAKIGRYCAVLTRRVRADTSCRSTRRALLIALGASALAAPLASFAQQQPAKIPRIGLLSPFSPSDTALWHQAFGQGLRDLGWVEGKNISIEYRYAEGRNDRLPDLAAELVRLKVDVIVTSGAPAAIAAKQATITIPIVMAQVNDPVGLGLIASLGKPGGNITGLANLHSDLGAKQLELLKEAAPKTSRVAILWNPANPGAALIVRHMQHGAQALGMTLLPVEVRDPSEVESAFATMTRERANALSLPPDPVFLPFGKRIVELVARNRLPAMYGWRELVEAGGLMAYGPSIPDMFRRAAGYVDKILKGAKPANLPIEQPTKFELVVNMKTAKALGIKIPNSILLRADKVIE